MSNYGDTSGGLSRAEAEALCVLHAMEQGPQPAAGLCLRLGMDRGLVPWVINGIEPLCGRGWLDEEGGVYSLTEAGRAHLSARLSALGLRRL